MGAEWSVQGSYRIGEQLDCSGTGFWDVYPAVKKTDDAEVMVFIHEKCDDGQVVEKCIKRVKTLRHPGLLKCIKIVESSCDLTMITEPLVPLKHVIVGFDINELVAGIYNIITTIDFLHNKCRLCYQSLCLNSVFVGQNNATWKLGGLEDLTPICNKTAKQDISALGKLILEILKGVDISEYEAVANFQDLIDTQLLNKEQEEFVDISVLLNDELFRNGYVAILNFLTNITVKTVKEKAIFFGQLCHKLQELPATLIANRLLHLLLSRFVLFDPIAVEVFLPHLLTPKIDNVNTEHDHDITPLLPEHIYKQCCLPILAQLFTVNDRHVRIILLRYFHLYVAMFDEDVLKHLVLNKLMMGLKDSDDELVSATFSALQFLVPILGAQVVLGGERTKQFIDSSPKFEASTFLSPKSEDNTKLPRNTLLHQAQSVQRSTNSQTSLKEKQQTAVGNSKSLEDKMRERERRREETKRRNEERRKKSALMKLQRETLKNVIKVDETTAESDEDFQAWGDEIRETDTNVEVSDGSDYGGVPSLSEVSLDSGFCEKTRVLKTLPPLQQTPSKNTITAVSDITTSPSPPEAKLTSNTVAKTIPDKTMKLSGKGKRVGKQQEAKNSVLTTNTGQSSRDTKTTTVTNIAPVDVPWEDFDINITSKKSLHENNDIFSDMAPNITFVAKAPIKGASMYSETLAVDNTDGEVVADGWIDDDW